MAIKHRASPPASRRHRGQAAHADALRQRIAADAARIMAQEGVNDFQTAKRKAALRLGLPETRHLPGNEEIEAALQEYLRLFHAGGLSQRLPRFRALAVEAMRFLSRFEPRLVGPILSGTVTASSAIELHLTADTPEEVGFWLQEHGIPYQQGDRRLRFGGDRHETFPAYRFTADGVAVELCVFPREAARETPLSPVDGKPMKRASLREVESLANGPGST
jgi:predicted component of type VI protein secretion system